MKIISALTIAAALAATSTPAFAQKLCPGLSGKERTACLKEQQKRDKAAVDKANKDLKNIDRAIGVAKGVKDVGRVAAGGAAGLAALPAGPLAGIAAGEAAERAYGAATDKIAKPCNASGNSGTAGSTPQRCE